MQRRTLGAGRLTHDLTATVTSTADKRLFLRGNHRTLVTLSRLAPCPNDLRDPTAETSRSRGAVQSTKARSFTGTGRRAAWRILTGQGVGSKSVETISSCPGTPGFLHFVRHDAGDSHAGNRRHDRGLRRADIHSRFVGTRGSSPSVGEFPSARRGRRCQSLRDHAAEMSFGLSGFPCFSK